MSLPDTESPHAAHATLDEFLDRFPEWDYDPDAMQLAPTSTVRRPRSFMSSTRFQTMRRTSMPSALP